MNKVAIIMPVLSQYEKAVVALESVVTKYPWTPMILDQWRYPKRCLSKAWNAGIARAASEGYTHIIVSNDDVIYSPWTIDAIVEGLDEASERVVMVTGCNNQGSCPDPEMMRFWGKPEAITQAESPDFSCFGIRSNFHGKVGTFDENFAPAYFEDNDMHYRIHLLGYSAITTTGAPYYHFGSASTRALTEQNHLDFRGCQNYFQNKWGSCNRTLIEKFTHPFNDPTNDPRIWKPEWRI